jgi:V/A-type H+-transporting ATPase subunit K
MTRTSHITILLALVAVFLLALTPAYGQEEAPPAEAALTNKFFSAAIAFGAAAIAAGWAISRAGSAGLAAAAERPEIRTVAIIISALGEAIAIYGLVVALLILGG